MKMCEIPTTKLGLRDRRKLLLVSRSLAFPAFRETVSMVRRFGVPRFRTPAGPHASRV